MELKPIAPYLPFKLKCFCPWDSKIRDVNYRNCESLFMYSKVGFAQPILYPLSDLTKEIEVNGEKFVPIYKLWINNLERFRN